MNDGRKQEERKDDAREQGREKKASRGFGKAWMKGVHWRDERGEIGEARRGERQK